MKNIILFLCLFCGFSSFAAEERRPEAPLERTEGDLRAQAGDGPPPAAPNEGAPKREQASVLGGEAPLPEGAPADDPPPMSGGPLFAESDRDSANGPSAAPRGSPPLSAVSPSRFSRSRPARAARANMELVIEALRNKDAPISDVLSYFSRREIFDMFLYGNEPGGGNLLHYLIREGALLPPHLSRDEKTKKMLAFLISKMPKSALGDILRQRDSAAFTPKQLAMRELPSLTGFFRNRERSYNSYLYGRSLLRLFLGGALGAAPLVWQQSLSQPLSAEAHLAVHSWSALSIAAACYGYFYPRRKERIK